MQTVRVEREEGVVRVTLNRPDVRNAFDDTLVRELTEVFQNIDEQDRVVVLAGEGKAFCAGADLAWMQKSATYTREQNLADARTMAAMFRLIDECPVPVIARVHGPALGGGMGLVACCDIVLALPEAKFGFTEVRLGIAPAVISPFVLPKIGAAQARRFFVTGEIFEAAVALEIGLVHFVLSDEHIDDQIMLLVDAIKANGPRAVRAAKRLVREVPVAADALAYTTGVISDLRAGPEGREGLAAFLEKRKPSWS